MTGSDQYTPEGVWYEVRVEGVLEARWTEWFGGLRIDTEGDEVTVISGFVIDQAALHGLLTRVRDLGLVLVSVNRREAPSSNAPGEIAPASQARQRRSRVIDRPTNLEKSFEK
jgi:hypothetical protein